MKRFRCFLSNVTDDEWQDPGTDAICSRKKKTIISQSGRLPTCLQLVDSEMKSYLPARIPQGKESPEYYVCDGCLTKCRSTLQTTGYFHFEPEEDDVLSLEKQELIASIFLNNQRRLESKKLISGTAQQFVVFRNVAEVAFPDLSTYSFLEKSDQAKFYNFLSDFYNHVKSTLKLKNYKIGGLEFIRNTNATKYEKPSQVRHLDAISNSPENLIGVFLPLRVTRAQSTIDKKIASGSDFQFGGSIGTHVLNHSDLVNFSWNLAPNIDIDAWKVSANQHMMSLPTSPGKYTAVVVNKVPHCGPPIPAFCERVILFAYFVPMNWKRVEDLDATITSVAFLVDDILSKDPTTNIKEEKEINAWFELHGDIHLHFESEIEWADDMLKRCRTVFEDLKELNFYYRRKRNGLS
jgi:hypothetical protein